MPAGTSFDSFNRPPTPAEENLALKSLIWKTGSMPRPPETAHLVGIKQLLSLARKRKKQLRAPSPSSEPAEYTSSVCIHHTPAPSATHVQAQSLISAISPQMREH